MMTVTPQEAQKQYSQPSLAFPCWPSLKSDEGSLLYQDWLVVIGGLIGDVSDSAAVWWSKVLEVVDMAYGSWISSSPIDRLRVEPLVPSELLQGRWTRVNLRVCSMLMAAIPGSIRSDVVARKCNQPAPALLFRLHTTYQPGGGSDKALDFEEPATTGGCQGQQPGPGSQ